VRSLFFGLLGTRRVGDEIARVGDVAHIEVETPAGLLIAAKTAADSVTNPVAISQSELFAGLLC
jgi:hypothetical protein